MNILFIEDDPMNRRVVKDMLDVAGATMTGAESGEIGLALIEAQDFEIVLLDRVFFERLIVRTREGVPTWIIRPMPLLLVDGSRSSRFRSVKAAGARRSSGDLGKRGGDRAEFRQ
ncbi:response regulator [Sphingomonas sp. DC1600-2]|uniref:response regulator n=1 Tax=unclassified Sphingomonas TaxID=196159 RepID=UPI003CEE7841